VDMIREVYCKNCNGVTEENFPFGYRAVGIETCSNCGGRDIEITLKQKTDIEQ